MQSLRPHPGPLNQNLSSNKIILIKCGKGQELGEKDGEEITKS